MMASPDDAPPPLAGLTVLDLTRLLPGPMATMHLADLGAEVIKIEDPGPGDYARTMGPAPAAGGDSFFFRVVNRNKRALRLDLKRAAGVAVLRRLAATADVLVEGFRPGVADRLGIGYEALRAVNPRLVYASISGYGQDGPWRERAGHDINYLATAGVLDQIGVAGGAPAVPNVQIGDLLGGALTPLVGLLAAVIGARTSGRGRHVDVAMTDAVFAHAVFPLVSVLAAGRAAPRGADLLSGGVPCYGVYRTADERYLAVGALEPKFWELLCASLDLPELAPHGLATGALGAQTRQRLAAVIAAQPLDHWSRLFAAVDCCVTPVLRLEEAMSHEQLLARGMVAAVDGVAQFAPPWHFSGGGRVAPRAAPAVGADGAALLAERGFAAAEIAALQAAGIV